MFAYKYFFMARVFPFKLSKREVPRGIVICNKITNWIFFSFNAIPPIIFGIGEIGVNEARSNGNMKLYL